MTELVPQKGTMLQRVGARLLGKQFLESALEMFTSTQMTPPSRTTRQMLDAYNSMPWLRAAVAKVSSSVGGIEWQVLRETSGDGRTVRSRLSKMAYDQRQVVKTALIKQGRLEILDSHPIYELFERGNMMLSGESVFRTTQAHTDLVGEAFWLKERNGLGQPIAIWPIPPHWVDSVPTPGSGNLNFKVRMERSAQPVDIPFTEFVWFKDPNPEDPYGRGSGIAKSLADELETDEYAAKHTKAWFYNGARPDFIVSADGLRPEETRRLEDKWLERHRGFWRRFVPAFLSRKVEVETLSQTFEDMQLTDLRKYERDTVQQVYGIPPELMGILQTSNRATIEVAGFMYSRWVLVPRLELMRHTLQHNLVPDFDGRIVIDYVTPVEEDKEFKRQVVEKAPWSFKIDEIRAMAGEDALEDGHGQNHVIPQKFDIVPDLSPRIGSASTQEVEIDE